MVCQKFLFLNKYINEQVQYNIYNFISCLAVIEITSGEYGDHNEMLVNHIDNGKSNDWSKDKFIEDGE